MKNRTIFWMRLSRVAAPFILLLAMSPLLSAQKTVLYDTEISVHLGMSVPTMNSRAFYDAPERIMYKVNVGHFKTYVRGYTSGVQLSAISNFQEITIPFYISFRSIPEREKELHFSNLLDLGDVAWQLFNFLVPQNIRFDAGPSFGYIFGNENTASTLQLNRHFVTSFDISVKLSYIIGQVYFILNPEFCFLATRNYSFAGINGIKSPISHFKGTVALGFSF
ncbi:MAG: hypothetical protein PHU27_10255 [Salinivirgaceae bacterium]|nr:hypothetical protein [Salinivirgaceae bacterium]MDY0282058.1 hypothetical protein [Salinivirgaceae bacterium]